MNILRDSFLTVQDTIKIAKSKKFLKKCDETVVKILAPTPTQHFYILVIKGLRSLMWTKEETYCRVS